MRNGSRCHDCIGGDLVTGVDVEHAKAQLSDWRRQMEHLRFMRIQIAPSLPWKLLAKAEALVAAVERVQALHTPKSNDYCRECSTPYPCATIRALEMP